MKKTTQLFRAAAVCAAFVSATVIFAGCASGTSTTSSDTSTTSESSPAATDTMSTPMMDTSSTPMDTTRRDSM